MEDTLRDVVLPGKEKLSVLARPVQILCDEKNFVYAIFACAAIKFLMAFCFPVTGDEAYLALWGKYPAWGYYDHPPMLGLLMYLFYFIGHSIALLRMLPIAVSVIVAFGIYHILRPYDTQKARLAAVFFAVCPFSMIFIFVATDIPLLLFCFLSAMCLYKAESALHGYGYYSLSGICLGLAFLSKYFALLLGLSYLIYFLSMRITARQVKGFALITLFAIPFILQNIFWNYHNGWPNMMHNWSNRLAGNHHNFATNLIMLVVMTLLILTPPILFEVYRSRTRIKSAFSGTPLRLFTIAFAVPMVIFVLVSYSKSVRPHWFLFFMPFACIAIAMLLDVKTLYKTMEFSIVVSAVQALVIITIPLWPIGKLQGVLKNEQLANAVAYLRTQDVIEPLAQYKDKYLLATESFSISALFEYCSGERVIVFGRGTQHGRQDDILTDFKTLNGSNFAILRREEPRLSKYVDYFENVEIRKFTACGAEFYLLLCHNFNYDRYRGKFLQRIIEKYYQIPTWVLHDRSFFHEKYNFPETTPATLSDTEQ